MSATKRSARGKAWTLAGAAIASLAIVPIPAANAAPPSGCAAINAGALKLQSTSHPANSAGNRADQHQCLSVGFNGGCFGSFKPSGSDAAAATPDASSQTFDLATGDTVNFAIKTTNPDVKAGLIVQQHYLLRTDPLSGNVFTATDSGRYTFKLSATGPKGQSAMAQATCGPSTQ